MVFSSAIFVFLFLPLVLGVYFLARPSLRNTWLLLSSLLFYAWGEPVMVAIMLISIVANWTFGVWVERTREAGGGKGVVALAIGFNLGLLVLFKYSDWIWGGLSDALVGLGVLETPFRTIGSWIPADSPMRAVLLTQDGHIRLPIGVSFFTFQATSYVIDVFRRDVSAEKSALDFGMYKAFFPQLIAGPIVRYRDVHEQIHKRTETLESFAYGIRRFIIGMGKKVLIANACGECADRIFGSGGAGYAGVPIEQLTTPVAWLGIVAYTLQIYFDFSGYSDMAIGLGRMFGFTFLENFNYPYIAKSITEFWRRWHMSLSTWFRDYLYIPLGGNRGSSGRTYFNLVLVFFLCGLWHGASINFVIWGLYHGVFLVFERLGLKDFLDKRAGVLRHLYVVLVVMIGWVFFRAETFAHAWAYLGALVGLPSGSQLVPVGELMVAANRIHHVDLYANSLTWFALACGLIGALPWLPNVVAWHKRLVPAGRTGLSLALEISALCALAIVFVRVAMDLAAGAYNPFIYFRF